MLTDHLKDALQTLRDFEDEDTEEAVTRYNLYGQLNRLARAVCEAHGRDFEAEMQRIRRTCRVCGGDGWNDESAELRRDGRSGDTTCIGCGGSGVE